MEKIVLSKNHLRAIGSSLLIVEELLQEMEYVLNHPNDGVLSKMNDDISGETKVSILKTIAETKALVEELSLKYDLPVRNLNMSRFIESRKTKIWEILSGTNSKKLKGYGKFPQEHSTEFDNDIRKLLDITHQIKML